MFCSTVEIFPQSAEVYIENDGRTLSMLESLDLCLNFYFGSFWFLIWTRYFDFATFGVFGTLLCLLIH